MFLETLLMIIVIGAIATIAVVSFLALLMEIFKIPQRFYPLVEDSETDTPFCPDCGRRLKKSPWTISEYDPLTGTPAKWSRAFFCLKDYHSVHFEITNEWYVKHYSDSSKPKRKNNLEEDDHQQLVFFEDKVEENHLHS